MVEALDYFSLWGTHDPEEVTSKIGVPFAFGLHYLLDVKVKRFRETTL